MCRRMVDIQSVTAEIRRGKKKERTKKKKPQDENVVSASATQGGHKKVASLPMHGSIVFAWRC